MSTEQPKKGKPSWRPAQALDVKVRDKSMRPRWVNKDPANISKKLAEGWTFVDKGQAEHARPSNVETGKGLGGMTEYRDVVLMHIPEETAQARAEYYREITDRSVERIQDKLQDDLAKGAGSGRAARASGTIVIE